jgi:hypothetical protein
MEKFEQVYHELREILKPYEPGLVVEYDTALGYSLNTRYSEKWKKPLFFGAATIKKNYVSFYLMPVYMYPDLLDGISPGLRARMQGKSCFNFKQIDPVIFAELTELTRRAVERVR